MALVDPSLASTNESTICIECSSYSHTQCLVPTSVLSGIWAASLATGGLTLLLLLLTLVCVVCRPQDKSLDDVELQATPMDREDQREAEEEGKNPSPKKKTSKASRGDSEVEADDDDGGDEEEGDGNKQAKSFPVYETPSWSRVNEPEWEFNDTLPPTPPEASSDPN